MIEEIILVTGSWGFRGLTSGGKSINALITFDELWVLSYRGTPESFENEWNAAKAKCAKECCNIIRPDMPPDSVVLPEDWSANNPTLFGVAGTYQFLSVVRVFS